MLFRKVLSNLESCKIFTPHCGMVGMYFTVQADIVILAFIIGNSIKLISQAIKVKW